MARQLNGRMHQNPMGTQEDKEALQPTAARHDGPWRQALLEGGRDPGVNIPRCRLGQVLIERGLPGRRHQYGKTSEGTEGAFLEYVRDVVGESGRKLKPSEV
jgi:hypothetical protein